MTREIGGALRQTRPGVFTDEPNIRPAGGFPWCADLPDQFPAAVGATTWSEACRASVREVGDWRRVRHNYYATLNDLFIERWARPFYEACEQRGLEFTGPLLGSRMAPLHRRCPTTWRWRRGSTAPESTR